MLGWPWFKPKRDPKMAYDSDGNAYEPWKTHMHWPRAYEPITYIPNATLPDSGAQHSLGDGVFVQSLKDYARRYSDEDRKGFKAEYRDPYAWHDPWENRP